MTGPSPICSTVGWVLNCIDGRPGQASKEHILPFRNATYTVCGKPIPIDAFDIGEGVGRGRCKKCLANRMVW